ncbi:unnamed protein product [Prorocentrum cordatum]|uniref:Uncharacterized protein n=1 Tax=Prorocentrum cordatum TaxID=2364126 RepID=A0ABN9SPD7_9DINO|nr:unnamed protein product [Polarella glacialis]
MILLQAEGVLYSMSAVARGCLQAFARVLPDLVMRGCATARDSDNGGPEPSRGSRAPSPSAPRRPVVCYGVVAEVEGAEEPPIPGGRAHVASLVSCTPSQGPGVRESRGSSGVVSSLARAECGQELQILTVVAS